MLYALWGGIFTNSYPEPLAPSARLGAISYSELPRPGFSIEVFHFHRRVITSRCRYVFVLTVGVRHQICPAGYECHNFERARFARNFPDASTEAHCIYIAKLASLSTLVKGKTRSLQQSSFFSLCRKKSIAL